MMNKQFDPASIEWAKARLLESKSEMLSGREPFKLTDLTTKILEEKYRKKTIVPDYAKRVLKMYEARRMYENELTAELSEMNNFELGNPTDFNLKNLLDSYFMDHSESEAGIRGAYEVNRRRSITYRFTKDEAIWVARNALTAFIASFKEERRRFPTDDEVLEYYHSVCCHLSIEYWANNYMFPFGYDGSTKPVGIGESRVRPAQKILWENNNIYVTITAARQEGKTFGILTALFHELFEKEGSGIIYVMHSMTQTTDMINKYIGQPGSIVHPELWDSPNFNLNKSDYSMSYINPTWAKGGRVFTAFGKIGGQSRYVGKTVGHVYADEVAMYDFDPITYITPCLKAQYPFSRLTVTSTVRATVGNPYADLIDNRTYRHIYRNINTGILQGSISADAYEELQSLSKSEEDFMTEYLCESPEGLSSMLTKADVNNGLIEINNYLMDVPVKSTLKSYTKDGMVTEERLMHRGLFMRDPRLDGYVESLGYKTSDVRYIIGVDWNPGNVGHIVYVLYGFPNPNQKATDDIDYIYVLYDAYQLRGTYINWNVAILVNCLADKYNADIIGADFGGIEGSTTVWQHEKYSTTPDGRVMWDRESNSLVGVKPFGFNRKGDMVTSDGKIIENSMSNVLISTGIDLIKKGILVIPGQEAPSLKIAEMPFVHSEIMFAKTIEALWDVETTTKDNYQKYLITRKVNVNTYADELRNQIYDSKQNKYVPENKNVKVINDDHVASVSTAIYYLVNLFHPKYSNGFEIKERLFIPKKVKYDPYAEVFGEAPVDKIEEIQNFAMPMVRIGSSKHSSKSLKNKNNGGW